MSPRCVDCRLLNLDVCAIPAVAGTAGAGAGAGGGSGVIAALFNGFGWRFGRNVLTVLVLDRSRQWLAPAVFRVDCDSYGLRLARLFTRDGFSVYDLGVELSMLLLLV